MKDWAGTGEAYASSYAALCAGTADALLDALDEPGGRTLLDVGSGAGTLAAVFADAGWSVTGCEPEATMRAVAARRHPGIEVVDGALPELPFADRAFDAVVANFVLNHVADPRASARELTRVASERVAATVWADSPSWLWREVCARAGLEPTAGERLPSEKDFERSVHGFGRMLRDAGWRDTTVNALTWTWHADPEALWLSAEGGVAAAGAFYGALDEADRRRFRRGFDAVCDERAVDGRLPLAHTAAVAAGRPR